MKEEAERFLHKAGRVLSAAEVLLKEGYAESAAGRAYYAMLHTAQALLCQRGLHYRKHAGVHSAFGEHFAKTGMLDSKFHRWLLDAFDDRLRGDYDFDALPDKEAASKRIEQAREFLDAVKKYLA